jgi:hypothetical protein
MRAVIRSPKNFWAGLLYLACGLAAMIIARRYGMGTNARMGPGVFPTVLGGILTTIGIVSLVRSMTVEGQAIGEIAWKALGLVTGATVLFGVLLRPAGLVVAMAVLILTSAAASVRFRMDLHAAALMIFLIAGCAAVFVKGLGLSIPVFGYWITG